MITYEEAIEIFSYDKETGIVTNRVTGKEVGSINKDGYLQLRYKNKNYIVHRLAWLLGTGNWPELFIDHINGNRQDNRLVNLRDVTRSVNQQNKHNSQGVSNLMGVTARKDGTFQASINWDNKKRHLGIFKTAEQAHNAYIRGKKRYHKDDPNNITAGEL